MGGKKWGQGAYQPPSASAPWRSSPNAKWGYWPGAWSPRRVPTEDLRYDHMEVKEFAVPDTKEEGTPQFHQALQKTLTTAKKLDNKLRKIGAEKEKRQRQWAKFEEVVKKSFLRQRKQFEADITRLDTEAQETLEAGHTASAQVKALAIHGAAPQPSEAMDVDAAWDAMWTRVEEPPSGATFLQEAMEAAEKGLSRSSGPNSFETAGHGPPPPPPPPTFGDPRSHFGTMNRGDPMPVDVSGQNPTEEELRILQKYWGSPAAPKHTPRPPMAVQVRPPSIVDCSGQLIEDGSFRGKGYAGTSPGHTTHRAEPYPSTSPLPTPVPKPDEVKPEGLPKHTGEPLPDQQHGLPPATLDKEPSVNTATRSGEPGAPLAAKVEHKREQLRGSATQPFRGLRADRGAGPVEIHEEELNSASPGLGRLE